MQPKSPPARFIRCVRRLVGRYLLQGPILKAWLSRQTSRLAREYFDFIVSYLDAPIRKKTPPRIPSRPLKRLLFVCENMWEQRELLPELQKLADVTYLDVKPAITTTNAIRSINRSWFETLDGEKEKFDATVIYLNAELLSEELLSRTRALTDGPFLGLNLDDKTSYPLYKTFPSHTRSQDYRRWAGAFDCNLTNSRTHVDIYRADGFECLYLPTGFHYDPAIQRFNPDEKFLYDLTFVGSCKPERKLFVDELIARGINLQIFGNGWQGAKFSDEGSRIFRQSQINLGFGYNVIGKQITNLKNRDFECPGSGGCYLTTYDWELAELFHVGKEILCYRDIDDFIEIYSYYHRRPNRCRQIAEAGFKRAIAEHTWAHRFQKAFEANGLTSVIHSPVS